MKRFLSYLWRIAATLAGVAVLAVGAIVLIEYYDFKKGLDGSPYTYPEVAEGIYVVRMNDHTYRLYRPAQRKYLTPRYGWISGSAAGGADSLIVFCPKNSPKCGYLNARTGKVALKPIYERAWDFGEGVAFVVDSGRLSLIGPDGEIRFQMPGRFPKKNITIVNMLYMRGLAAVPDSTGRYGLIDTRGAWILPPTYTEIGLPHSDGFRIVVNGNRYGLLAPDFTLSIPLEYDNIDFSQDGHSVFASKDGFCKRLSFDGKVLNDCVISDTFPLYYSAYDPKVGETISVLSQKFLKYQAGGSRYGILNLESGEVILPALYDDLRLLSPDLIIASLQPRRQIVFDAQGRPIDNPGQ